MRVDDVAILVEFGGSSTGFTVFFEVFLASKLARESFGGGVVRHRCQRRKHRLRMSMGSMSTTLGVCLDRVVEGREAVAGRLVKWLLHLEFLGAKVLRDSKSNPAIRKKKTRC